MFKKILVPLMMTAASATALSASEIQIGGFGTFAAGFSNIDRESDVSGNKSFPGYVNDFNVQEDSLFALQFNADVTENMGAVAQVKADFSDRDQMVSLEWGYAFFDVNDDLRVIIGRYRPPIFLFSDYVDVGYAYPWITLPGPIYMHSYMTNMDGLNVNYVLPLGDDYQIAFTLFGGTGQSTLDANDDLPINFDNVAGIEMVLSNDYFRLRAGYDYALTTIDYDNMALLMAGGDTSLVSTFQIPAIQEELELDRSVSQIISGGFDVEYMNVLLVGEYFAQIIGQSVFNRIDGWYATVGYRFGDFMPHYTYSRATSGIEEADTGNLIADAVIDVARTSQLENTINNTVGLRYEVNSMAAVKAEWTGTTNQDLHRYPNHQPYYNVYKIALNVIF